MRVRRSDLDRFLAAGGSSDPATAEELEALAELLQAAAKANGRERVEALRDLAVAADTLAARLQDSVIGDAGKVDDTRR